MTNPDTKAKLPQPGAQLKRPGKAHHRPNRVLSHRSGVFQRRINGHYVTGRRIA